METTRGRIFRFDYTEEMLSRMAAGESIRGGRKDVSAKTVLLFVQNVLSIAKIDAWMYNLDESSFQVFERILLKVKSSHP